MRRIYILSMLFLATSFGWKTSAQNGGEDCSSAVIAIEGTITQTQINDLSGGANGGDSAWFVYTPAGSGTIDVASCLGGSDTRLFIWDTCTDAAAIATNDDSCPFATDGTGFNYASEISGFEVVGGDDYFIQWDDRWNEDPFDWTLTFTPPPTGGETCGDALAIVPGLYVDVTIIDGSTGASQGDATAGLWYSYTPVESGTININSCGSDPSGVDTRLFVYTDGCDTLTPVANDDDGCDAPNDFGSSITDVSVVGGVEYLIEWDDRWEIAPFDWELTWTPLPDPVVLPIILENQFPVFNDFNGSFTQAIANPDASGANTSATVAENTVPANAGFAGVNFALDTNIDIALELSLIHI